MRAPPGVVVRGDKVRGSVMRRLQKFKKRRLNDYGIFRSRGIVAGDSWCLAGCAVSFVPLESSGLSSRTRPNPNPFEISCLVNPARGPRLSRRRFLETCWSLPADEQKKIWIDVA